MEYDSVLGQQSIFCKKLSLIMCVWKPGYMKSSHIFCVHVICSIIFVIYLKVAAFVLFCNCVHAFVLYPCVKFCTYLLAMCICQSIKSINQSIIAPPRAGAYIMLTLHNVSQLRLTRGYDKNICTTPERALALEGECIYFCHIPSNRIYSMPQ